MNTDTSKPHGRPLRGLERLCQKYGRMQCGETLMLWDYATHCAVPERDMPIGGSRWQLSEKARFQQRRFRNA